MSRSSLWTAAVLLTLVVCAWAAPAHAEPPHSRRVVLLETPAALERALRTALMPWGMRVARSQTRARPRPPKSAEQARTLARRLRADALVWLAPALQRHELWLYDGSNGTLTARSVPAPPFDETRAAALALSVKTELRKGTLADVAPASDAAAKSATAEKIEADPVPPAETTPAERSPAPSEPAESPTPTPNEPTPPQLPPPASPELDTTPFVRVDSAPNAAPRWKLVAHAAARQGANTLGGTEGRYGVEARWAPWADPLDPATIWLTARVDLGLPRSVANTTFRGEYSEIGAELGAGVGVPLSRWFALGMQVSAGLRTATMAGTLSADDSPGDRTKRALQIHVRPELELSLGALGLLVQPALGVGLPRQRFTGDDVEAMETKAVWWQLGAGVRIALE